MVRIIDNLKTRSQDFYRSTRNLFQLLGITIDERPEVIIDFLEDHGIALTEYPDDTELVEAVIYGLERNNSAFNAELSIILNNQLLNNDEDHYLTLRGEIFKKPGHLPPMPIPSFRPPIKPRPIRPSLGRPMVRPEPMKPLVKPQKPTKPMKPLVKPAKPSKPANSLVKPTTTSRPVGSSVKPMLTPINAIVNQVSEELPKNDNLKDQVKNEAIKSIDDNKTQSGKPPETNDVQKENDDKKNNKTLLILGAVAVVTIGGFIIWKVRNNAKINN